MICLKLMTRFAGSKDVKAVSGKVPVPPLLHQSHNAALGLPLSPRLAFGAI